MITSKATPLSAVVAAALLTGGAVPPGIAAGHSQRAGLGDAAPAAARHGLTAYVAVGRRHVIPINTATGKPGKPIIAGPYPGPMAVTPDGKTIYVTNELSNTVTPISTATNEPGTPIKVGKSPESIAVTPDGKTVYVGIAAYVGAPSTVTPISTATDKPGKPIKVGGLPSWIAVTPDGKTAYVTDASSDTVTPINTATNTAGKPIKVGRSPIMVVVTPDGKPPTSPTAEHSVLSRTTR